MKNDEKCLKNEKKMKKMKKKTRKIAIFQKMKNCNFPRVFFIIFFSFFIIFASSGAKIFRKIKNCNFPRVFFSFFYHCFIIFFIIFASSGGIDEK